MKIAIHSPDPATLRELKRIVGSLGHDALDAPSIPKTVAAGVDLVLAEWALTSVAADFLNGLETAAACLPPVPFVVLLSARSMSFAERARAAGAADVLFLPPDYPELQAEIEAIERRSQAGTEEGSPSLRRLRETSLVGEHPRFRQCVDEMLMAARSNANVLLLGETGTGKEMFAQAIHELSGRSRHQCIAVNCASLPRELLGSELFGHAKGAFTGADKPRTGRFEEVGEGTLFLDEIGDMELSLQTTFLRVIDKRVFQRVGDNGNIPFRGRLVCATSVDLNLAADQGRFRTDLLGRIDQFRIVLPPLRERRSDIPLLAAHLLQKHAKDRVELSESTKRELQAFDFPMNVRQLENVMVSALTHAGTRTVILPRDLPADMLRRDRAVPRVATFSVAIPLSMDYHAARAEAQRGVDRVHLQRALDENSGNQSAAATALGIDRKTFGQRLQSATQTEGTQTEESGGDGDH